MALGFVDNKGGVDGVGAIARDEDGQRLIEDADAIIRDKVGVEIERRFKITGAEESRAEGPVVEGADDVYRADEQVGEGESREMDLGLRGFLIGL